MKEPFAPAEIIREIASRHPTPFHLYDETRIRANARELKDAFAWNPGFREYFAVKANPNPAILAVLAEEGCGADCSSLTELMIAQRSGLRGNDIMFSSNVTPAEDFRLASELGALINLDDISHIDFLERTAGLPETIFLRYNPGNSFTIGNDIMSRPGDAKYGFTRDQLEKGMAILASRGVKHFGIHSFLSSNTTDAAYYPALAELLFKTAVELAEKTGLPLIGINLSGGIGIPYRPEERPVDLRAVGEAVRRKYEELLVPAGLGDAAVFTELGRRLLGPAGCLVSRVIHEKRIHKDYLGMDACAADLLRPAMYGAYHHIDVLGREGEAPTCVRDVVGGLCENNDKFAVDRPLPPVGVGDLLVIRDTGAHGRAMGYNYNGKLRSAELLLKEDGTVRSIRRAETPQDYFATLDVLDGYP